MSANSNPRRQRSKSGKRPAKPYPEFPLYAHPLGYWSKKVNRQIVHFGRWGRVVKGKLTPLPYEASWRTALANFKLRVDDAQAGRIEGVVVDAEDESPSAGLTIRELCREFYERKKYQLEAKEIGKRMFHEYESITDLLYSQFGRNRLVASLTPKDFQQLRSTMAERWGPVRLGNSVQRVRTVFNYGTEMGLINRPISFGPDFKKPSAKTLREQRNKNGKRMLEVAEVRLMLDASAPQLKAMVLLGVNCGFGNHDCATLPETALDLDRGWVDFPRPKTAIMRRCPLWRETIEALRVAAAERPHPKTEDAQGKVFVTTRGRPWLSGGIANPVSVATSRLMKAVGVHRPGLSFYVLRHVFRTAADGAGDQVAANAIMGHADNSMAATYREYISDERLLAVTKHVHDWLFAEGSAA